MKKNFALILFLVVSVVCFAQKGEVYLDEDLSNGALPTGWTIDAHSANWVVSNTAGAGGTAPELKFNYSPTFNGDSHFITPEINTEGVTSVILSFNHYINHFGSGYKVGVATRSNGGDWTSVWENYSSVVEKRTLLISNNDVGATDFQFCFYFSGNSYQINYWHIDDVLLFAPYQLDIAMASVNTIPYQAEGDIEVDATIANIGLTSITQLDINYQIDDETIVTEQLTGIDIATTESYNYTFATTSALIGGNYDLKVWVSNINGNGDDDDATNDLLNFDLSIASQTVTNYPLFEEFTSSTCGPCATFNSNTFTPFLTAHEGECAVIKYQMDWPGSGDPYYTAEGGVRKTYYGVSGVPALYTGGGSTSTSSGAVNTAFTTQQNKSAFFSIDATHQIDGDNITVQVDVLPFITGTFTMHTVGVENVTTENTGNNGETEFHYVMMKMLPDASGTEISFNADNNSYISETYDMSTTNVEEMSDLSIVVFIQNNATKDVFQSAWSEEAAVPELNYSANIFEGATDVQVDADIELSFNQAVRLVDDTEITSENITDFLSMTSTTKENITFDATINDAKTGITINPTNDLPENTTISLTIAADAIENYEDELFAGDTFEFITGEVVTGINPVEYQINIYPNPATDIVYIKAPKSQILIYNIQGELVFKANNVQSIDVSSFAGGIYYVKFVNNNFQTTRLLNIVK